MRSVASDLMRRWKPLRSFAEAVNRLGSETLGWLNKVPPAISEVKAEAKLPMPLLTWARAETWGETAIGHAPPARAAVCRSG